MTECERQNDKVEAIMARMMAQKMVITMALVLAMVMVLATSQAGVARVLDNAQNPPKEKKQPKIKAEQVESPAQGVMPPGNDNDVIDYRIAEMLAGWQLGDTQLMHTVYADDVSVVSGAYEPPIIGWTNFLATYQKLRARISSAQKDRTNTYTMVHGTLAWSSFQWEFHGVVDGAPAHWRGQTTLVLEKRAGKWMIVHDHTSVVAEASAPAAAKP